MRRGALLGVLLAVVYGYLFLTLMSEGHALLLFAALSLGMPATRNLDWYTLGERISKPGNAQRPVDGQSA